jgi:hypothetical protein
MSVLAARFGHHIQLILLKGSTMNMLRNHPLCGASSLLGTSTEGKLSGKTVRLFSCTLAFCMLSVSIAHGQILVPPTISPPAVVRGAPDLGGLIKDNVDLVVGVTNAEKQFAKMESARQAVADSIPEGSSENYDVVVQGDQFIGYVKSGAEILAPGGVPPTRFTTVKIVGAGPAIPVKTAAPSMPPAPTPVAAPKPIRVSGDSEFGNNKGPKGGGGGGGGGGGPSESRSFRNVRSAI